MDVLVRHDLEVDQALLDKIAAYNITFQREVRQQSLVAKRAERAVKGGSVLRAVDKIAQLLPDRRCAPGGAGGLVEWGGDQMVQQGGERTQHLASTL